jgi:hypothetical protein
MKTPKVSRRDMLKGSTAFAVGTVFAAPATAAAPPATAITPQLIEAAKKEGKVIYYTADFAEVEQEILGFFQLLLSAGTETTTNLLTGIAASGLVFSLCIQTIAHIFALLSGPVAKLFSKPLDQSLWPNGLEFVCAELWMIVPPIFVCLIIAVTLLVPREPTQSRSAVPSRSCSIDDLVGFFRSGSSIFVACIVVSLLIKVSQLFYEYGTMLLPREALSSSRLLLPVIQSFIPVAVCLFTTWYLACSREGAPRRRLGFAFPDELVHQHRPAAGRATRPHGRAQPAGNHDGKDA